MLNTLKKENLEKCATGMEETIYLEYIALPLTDQTKKSVMIEWNGA